jgi:hypothetical protein
MDSISLKNVFYFLKNTLITKQIRNILRIVVEQTEPHRLDNIGNDETQNIAP